MIVGKGGEKVRKGFNVLKNNQNKIGEGKRSNQCNLKVCCYLDRDEKGAKRFEERTYS
jgi:hypothetical protein